ncbi:amidohydrolase family protein [Novipirellula sp. SH528]|uniref:amidohydrolase family protein n=1 Tax=Novipirellula sp. SH528 TaxID=3454466 RepID=UPI003F9EBDF5
MNKLNRRDLLRCLSTLPLSSAAAFADDAVSSVVVDSHLHCFAGQDPRFPYHARAPYRPDAAATPEHLLKCMDNAGVDFAVVVHPEPYQDDHHYLEHCLNVGQGRLKGTCLFFADRPGSVEKMAPLVQRNPGGIVAARVHAYAPDRLPPFGTKELRHLWKTASDLGLAIQLHFEPRYAPGLEPLIREFTDTTVIIDHLGRPMQGTPEEHEVVVRWSRFPNTVMKVSSIPDQNSYPHRDVQPIIRRLTDAFGAERMIYGGGFNSAATGESYRDYRISVADLLSHLSPDDRTKILGGTAAKLFGFNGS